jgi:hypothetical protein
MIEQVSFPSADPSSPATESTPADRESQETSAFQEDMRRQAEIERERAETYRSIVRQIGY